MTGYVCYFRLVSLRFYKDYYLISAKSRLLLELMHDKDSK
jgi:hypothetical protein